jgi:carbon monoxide dehydrogenase subunit G
MKLREVFEVAQPVASVWAFFEKTEKVAQCIPGVEDLGMTSADEMEVRITQSVGPMSATFAATVRIVERVPEKLIAFTATGRTVKGAMGNVRSSVEVHLEEAGPERTVVTVDADVALAGALGTVGQKVVAKQAGKVAAAFSRELAAALDGKTTAPLTAPIGVPAAVTSAPAVAVRETVPTVEHAGPSTTATPLAAAPSGRAETALAAAAVALGAASVALGAASVAMSAMVLRRVVREAR